MGNPLFGLPAKVLSGKNREMDEFRPEVNS
jgi:hypothetical protein